MAVPVWRRDMGPSPDSMPFVSVHSVTSLRDRSTLVVSRMGNAVTALRYDSGGRLLSSARVFGWREPLAVDAAGSLFATARSPSGAIELMKFDAVSGLAAWRAPAIVSAESLLGTFATSLATDGSGNVVVAGRLYGQRDRKQRGWQLALVDGISGAVTWTVSHPAEGNGRADGPIGVEGDPNGDIVVAVAAGTEEGSAWGLRKYEGRSGVVLWERRFTGDPGGMSVPRRLALDSRGDVVVTGEAFEGNRCRWSVVKVDGRTGEPAWGPVRLDSAGSPSRRTRAVGLVVDPAGDVLASGSASSISMGSDELVKLDGRTGKTIWRSAGGSREAVVAFGVDLRADVLIAETTPDVPFRNPQLWVRKCDGATGRTLWGPVPIEPGRKAGLTVPLFVDEAGDLRFVATFSSSGYGSDAKLVSFSGGDGRLLHESILPADAGVEDDRPAGAARDSRGDVLVMTESGGVAKVDGITGALRWGPVWPDLTDDPAHQPIWGGRLALDRRGDVFVSGTLREGPRSVWWTMKRDGVTGGVLWGPRRLPQGQSAGLATDSGGDLVEIGLAGVGEEVYRSPRDESDDEGPSRGAWWVMKSDGATGEPRWSAAAFLGVPGAHSASWTRIRVDDRDDVLLVVSNEDGTVVGKVCGAKGDPAWGPIRLGGPAYALDLADGGNPVVLSNQSGRWPTNWLCSRISSRSGAVVWESVEPADAQASLFGWDLVVDRAGDVVVAGKYDVWNTLRGGWALAKYDGATGKTVRRERFAEAESPEGSWPKMTGAWRVAELPDGDLLIAGRDDGLGQSVLMKLGRQGSEPLWTRPLPELVDSQGALLPRAGGSRDEFTVLAKAEAGVTLLHFAEDFAIDVAGGSMPPALAGEAYSYRIPVHNGRPPYRFSVESGPLPAGLSLGKASGLLSGTPGVPGAASVLLAVRDADGRRTRRTVNLLVASRVEGRRAPVHSWCPPWHLQGGGPSYWCSESAPPEQAPR
ncbi:MAG: hypothetical protein IPN83_13535 [Holophagales bacterium]|nr:hypothetical protein [Holophagales bacterium]